MEHGHTVNLSNSFDLGYDATTILDSRLRHNGRVASPRISFRRALQRSPHTRRRGYQYRDSSNFEPYAHNAECIRIARQLRSQNSVNGGTPPTKDPTRVTPDGRPSMDHQCDDSGRPCRWRSRHTLAETL